MAGKSCARDSFTPHSTENSFSVECGVWKCECEIRQNIVYIHVQCVHMNCTGGSAHFWLLTACFVKGKNFVV